MGLASRMLFSRLFDKECAANQLRAEDVYIRAAPNYRLRSSWCCRGARSRRLGSGRGSIGTIRCQASGERYVSCDDLNFPVHLVEKIEILRQSMCIDEVRIANYSVVNSLKELC
jgi:hypothetical protein